MLRDHKPGRLSVLIILASLAYIFLVISSFVNYFNDSIEKFEAGSQNSRYEAFAIISNFQPENNLYLSLKPKKGYRSYPDSLINLKNGQVLKTKFTHPVIYVSSPLDQSMLIYSILKVLFSLIIFYTFILLPFHFYKLIGALKKNFVFEKKSIRLFQWLGYELLVIYFGNTLLNFMNYKINRSLVSISDYEIVIDSTNGIWLLFGIAILLIAEILSKANVTENEEEFNI